MDLRVIYLYLSLCLLILIDGFIFAKEIVKTSKNSNFFSTNRKDLRLPEDNSKRVKINLELIVFDNDNKSAVLPQNSYDRYKVDLSTKLNIQNHFYYKGMHIRIRPLKHQSKLSSYSFEASFFHQYTPQVEEEIGKILVRGELIKHGKNYEFVGKAVKLFKDKWNSPKLKVIIGGGLPVRNIAVSKTNHPF